MPTLCVDFNTAFADWHPDIDNNARLAVDIAHSPSGAGWRQITHYDQTYQAKRFQRYDFGKKENLVRYGQEQPPEYDLT